MPLTLLQELRRDARELVPTRPAPVEMRLQNVCVRLLFDPGFVAELHRSEGAVLSELEIPEALRKQLLGVDRRVWTADALRPQRALQVLVEEFKNSTALFLSEQRRFGFLREFFASSCFHSGVQSRGYMALSFLEYLALAIEDGKSKSPHALAVLALEGGMALARRIVKEARRDPERFVPGKDEVRLAPGFLPIHLPGGTLETVQRLEQWFFELELIPAQALCDDLRRPDDLPELDWARSEWWLLEPASDQRIEIGGISEDFHHVLQACRRSGCRDEIRAALRPRGLDQRADGMIEALVEAGVLQTG